MSKPPKHQPQGVNLTAEQVASWAIDLSRPVDGPPATFEELDYIAWLFMRMNAGASLTTRWNCTRGDIREQFRLIALAEWCAWARDEEENRQRNEVQHGAGKVQTATGRVTRNGAGRARRPGQRNRARRLD